MSSVLSDYIKKEQLLKQLQEELNALQDNKELQQELEFKDALTKLMTEYGKVSREVCEMLDPNYEAPGAGKKAASNTDGRKKRTLKVYKNPHTGEVVETRGGNQKQIQEWKAEFGNEEVVGWVVEERE
ncbi:histone-like nucleoid-structuring protein, MvaT/MvaU family [Vreelandella neptunia]|uniref:Histone-like nucleoid-structuring protein, MvaT/MvaU family n=1 Tax=Vreelandella neptunia TaxID=115551 RepID=A0ABZ0YM42_9GAMM|nr:histone-like nucleoid-structuring protein, MvaT/MvaU family [Halomonas neptunia]MDN3560871.1 H-NS histone [Halomonas neptunia]WQH13182.1 histone-like nucleoid-structuring protein, MvaT/MvaU family [Halomonas neptunia]